MLPHHTNAAEIHAEPPVRRNGHPSVRTELPAGWWEESRASCPPDRHRALREGAFGGLSVLLQLQLSANNISTIKPGAFRGLRSLEVLGLQNNPLPVLRAGTFEGLRRLRLLFLDDCDRLREVESGAFADTPRLEYVWVPGTALNCSRLVPQLPGDAACVSQHCDVERPDFIGDKWCDGGEYDTAECAWDGGDCS